MNIIKINNKLYKYESYFEKSKKLDQNNNPFPIPAQNKNPWQNRDAFINKLKLIQNYLESKKKISDNTGRPQICLLDKKK